MIAMLAMVLATHFFMMSDRAHFGDADDISSHTEVVEENGIREQKINFRQFKGKKLLVLVHGYNNNFHEALATYHQIHGELGKQDLYDVIIGYFWPGYDSRLEYFAAKKNADLLASRMRTNLSALLFFAEKVDLLAHSMGNRLVLEALDHFTPINQTKTVQNFYSIAAAVDNESIEKNQRFFFSTKQCQNIYVFYSERDKVLKLAYSLAERDKALGYEGAENFSLVPENVQFIDCTPCVDGHSAYFTSQPFYSFIANQLAKKISFSNQHLRLLADGGIELISE